MDKSCPLCRKPLPPGPEKLFDLGYGMIMKIGGAIDRSRPGVDMKTPAERESTGHEALKRLGRHSFFCAIKAVCNNTP